MASLTTASINTIRIIELEPLSQITGRELLLVENETAGESRNTTINSVSNFVQDNVRKELQPQLDQFAKIVVMYSGEYIPIEDRDHVGQSYYINVTKEYDEGIE